MDSTGEDVSKPIQHPSQAELSSVNSSPVMDAANHKATAAVFNHDAEPTKAATDLEATLAPNDIARKIA